MSYHTKCIDVLGAEGPLTLRELSEKVSAETGRPCRYEDLLAALEVHRKLGDVEVDDTARDYRQHEWKVVR